MCLIALIALVLFPAVEFVRPRSLASLQFAVCFALIVPPLLAMFWIRYTIKDGHAEAKSDACILVSVGTYVLLMLCALTLGLEAKGDACISVFVGALRSPDSLSADAREMTISSLTDQHDY